jgi:hypothetical protein
MEMKIEIFRNKIKEVLKDYSRKEYFYSEENGDEPNIEDFVDRILNLIIGLTKL